MAIRNDKPKAVYLQPPYIGWDYVARVNATGRSLMSVPVTNEQGSQPIVGEVAYIGTATRWWDIGITRIRGYQTGTILVAENELEWRPNQWVWCPRVFAPMAKIQRVAGGGERPQVWMDYDVVPQPLPPKVNLFGPLVVDVGRPSVFTIEAIAMESGATIPSGPTVQALPDGIVTPGGWQAAVMFPTPGYKIIIATVTDSNGQTGRRVSPVICGLEPDEHIAIESVTWAVNSGIKLSVRMPATPLRPFHPAIFRYNDRFIVLWHIEPEEETTADYRHFTAQFLSATAFANHLISHSMLLEDGQRSSWYTVPGLNARRAIHLMLGFHSTINGIVSMRYSSDRMELPIHTQQFHQGPLLSQITQLCKDCLSAIYEELDGTVYFAPEPMLLWDRSSVPIRGFTPAGQIREIANLPVGQLQVGGFAYQTPYLARWPGTTPEIWSITEDRKGLVVSSQDDLNRVAGILASYGQTNDITFLASEDYDTLPPMRDIWYHSSIGNLSPSRASVRFADGVDAVAELTAKRDVKPLAGETIIIPSEPAPPPIEYPPPPPIEPPPSSPTGYGFVRCSGHIVRTSQIYSIYPHWEIICTASNYPHPTDPNHTPSFVDFRYIDTPTGAVIIASVSSGYLIRCNNPTADSPEWETLLNPYQLVGQPTDFTVGSLMTMVQDWRHIGVMLTWDSGGHIVDSYYVYTNDYGQNWARSPVILETTVYHPDWQLCETAGTNQITAVANWAGGSRTKAHRSDDRGQTWGVLSDGDGMLAGSRYRKPWQQGTSGTKYYVTGIKFSNIQKVAGLSVDNLDTVVETFPNASDYNTVYQGIEYWTFNMNEVHLIAQQQSAVKIIHAVSFDGCQTWNTTYTSDFSFSGGKISLRGNPANNREWTFVIWMFAPPDRPETHKPFIYQSLDGGYTFDDLTGDWYNLGIGSFSRDFLILPPFVVKIRREQ